MKFIQLWIYANNHVEITGFHTAKQESIDKEIERVKNKYSKLPKNVTKMLLKVNNKTVWKL